MITFSLQSGSNGNCIYVETPDARLLFDAGISGRAAKERLVQHGRAIEDVNAIIISHDHRDHVCGAGVFQRKFGLPIYLTGKTYNACRSQLGTVRDLRYFDAGCELQFGSTVVGTVSTAHDGADGVAFTVISEGKKLGVFTDLGHRFDGLEEWISGLDMLYLESNYDPQMLNSGPYPPWLKRRICGQKGHLSNMEASELVRDCGGRLQLYILSHLSEQNNNPAVAMRTAKSILGGDFPLAVAPRTAVSEVFSVR